MSKLRTIWFGIIALLGLALATPALAHGPHWRDGHHRGGPGWYRHHGNRVIIVNPAHVYRYPRHHAYYHRYHPYYRDNVIIIKKHPRHYYYR